LAGVFSQTLTDRRPQLLHGRGNGNKISEVSMTMRLNYVVDGRTQSGRLMKQLRTDLVAHVGGRPNAVQRALIERAARLNAHLEALDRKLDDGEELTPDEDKRYVSWHGALVRVLSRLGIKDGRPIGAPIEGPSLSEYLASKATAS
jgi:hypothetical protein